MWTVFFGDNLEKKRAWRNSRAQINLNVFAVQA
jgi:hypothetical protein